MPANIKSIELRNLQIEDYKELKKSMIPIQKWQNHFGKKIIELLLNKFPEGQL
jgi:hypothetical protein